MDEANTPWIMVSQAAAITGLAQAAALSPASPGQYHALFAAQVRVPPFDERVQSRWGWTAQDLLLEALDRQLLFIESQHPRDDLAQEEEPARRTLALRCLVDPAHGCLSLVLIGKVCDLKRELARQAALAYWRELAAVFPYDYLLQPVTGEAGFHAAAGWGLLAAAGKPQAVVEICRFEGALVSSPSVIYLLGEWQRSLFAGEQIWRALAGCDRPLLLNVMLRPSVLLDAELLALAEMAAAAEQAAAQAGLATVHREAEWAARAYAGLLSNLRYPYLVRLHLVCPQGVPEYLLRAVGSALTHAGQDEPPLPGYQSIPAGTQDCLEQLRVNLAWLEPDAGPHDSRFAGFGRVRYLAGAHQASALFRLPFPGGSPAQALPFAPLPSAG